MDIATLEEVQEKLRVVLSDFTQDQNTELPPPGSAGWRSVDLDAHTFAVPSILLTTLHSIKGWDKYGPEEKMRWGIPATYKGIDFSFELRKFGLRLLVRDVPEAEPSFVQQLCRKIQSAIHVTERFRNTLAHGGFEKGLTSLYFHFQGVGALPAALSRHQGSWEFQFVPLPEATFEDVAKIFDEFDAYLETGPTKYGIQFAKTGLDVCFDTDSRTRYVAAMASEAEFEEMIAFLSYDHDRNVNMDY